MSQLVKKRAELVAKRAVIQAAYKAMKNTDGEHDFSLLTKFGEQDLSGKTAGERGTIFQKAVDEVNELGMEVNGLRAVDLFEKTRRIEELESSGASLRADGLLTTPAVPETGNKSYDELMRAKRLEGPKPIKTLGELVLEHPECRKFMANTEGPAVKLHVADFGLKEMGLGYKAAASIPAVPMYLPGYVPAPGRTLEALEVVPKYRTNTDTIKHRAASAKITGVAVRAVAGGYAAAPAWNAPFVTTNVRNVGVWIGVEDETFEDAPQLEAIVNSELMYALKEYVEKQVFTGTGASNQVNGILGGTNTIPTAAKGAGIKKLDGLSTAIAKVAEDGNTLATAHIMTISDWAGVRTQKGNDQYLLGTPGQTIMPVVWGVPVVQSAVTTNGNVFTGDFTRWSAVYQRLSGTEITLGYAGSDFTNGMRTIRARFRLAAINKREKAFFKTSGFNVA